MSYCQHCGGPHPDDAGFGPSCGRTGNDFAKILSAAVPLIGFFMAGGTARKQGLHDLIAHTLVVRGRT